MKYISKYMKPTNSCFCEEWLNSCFCEEWLNISFEGDIKDKQQVSIFLNEYLDDAKNLYSEIAYEYETLI